MLDRDVCPGAKRLAEVLSPKVSMTQKGMAESLGVTPQAVSSWIVGRARPSPPLRAAIERLTGIPADSWLTDDERALVERVESPKSS